MPEFSDSRAQKKYQEIYPPDTTLFEEGESGDFFFLLKEGKVQVYKNNDGDELHLGNVGPGELLGEMAVIGDRNVRSATAVCYTKVRCLKFSEEEFDQLSGNSEKFRKEVFSLLSKRLHEVDNRLWEAKKLENKLHKTAFLLIYLIDQEDWYFQSDKTIDIDPSIDALSAFSNLDPEILKKLLSVTDTTDLLNYSPEEQEKIQSAAHELIETALPLLDFRIPEYKIQDDKQPSEIESIVSDKIAMSERLFQVLKNKGKDLEKEEYQTIIRQYQKLREYLEDLKKSDDESEYSVKRLEANIDSIKRKFNQLDLRK